VGQLLQIIRALDRRVQELAERVARLEATAPADAVTDRVENLEKL